MPKLDNCPICNELVNAPHSGLSDGYQVSCLRCGKYTITASALPVLLNSGLTPRQKANMSGWINENQSVLINTNNVNILLEIKTPSFHERADKLLLFFEKKTEYAGHDFGINDNSWLSPAWCINNDELNELIYFLLEKKRLRELKERRGAYRINADGWAYLEDLKKVNADSQQGFVAMWFDDSMMKIYDKVISKGILNAGYNPHLVINREHNGKIDDEIIAQIRRSRFLLADFTGHRGGVYYEAGFAQGLGIEVIWTCNKDDLNNLHFDIRQYNCIDWTDKTENDLKEFKRRITSRIEASIGRGSYQQQE